MKNIIIVLFVYAISTTVYSQANWVFYSETENTRWYVDKNSVLVNTSDESELKVWLKCENIIPVYNEINKLYIEKLLVEEVIYCNTRMHQTLGMTAYFTNGTNFSTNKTSAKESIIPDTPFDFLLKEICK